MLQVKVASEGLHERITRHITIFMKTLCGESNNESSKTLKGSITLAFVTNRKGSWVLGSEPSAWERWIFNIGVDPSISGMF